MKRNVVEFCEEKLFKMKWVLNLMVVIVTVMVSMDRTGKFLNKVIVLLFFWFNKSRTKSWIIIPSHSTVVGENEASPRQHILFRIIHRTK